MRRLLLLVYAQTDNKISAFLVDRIVRVFQPQRHRQIGDARFGDVELIFEDCRVPDANILEAGEGVIHMMRNLEIERLTSRR